MLFTLAAEQRTCCIPTYGPLVTVYTVAYCCNCTVLTCLYDNVDSLMNCTYIITLCSCYTNYMITAHWNWYLIALVSIWCTCVHCQPCLSLRINVVSHFCEQREFVWEAAWGVNCQPQQCRNCVLIVAQYLRGLHLAGIVDPVWVNHSGMLPHFKNKETEWDEHEWHLDCTHGCCRIVWRSIETKG
jgi:hypothetical protein